MKQLITTTRRTAVRALALCATAAILWQAPAQAAVPGITGSSGEEGGSTFNLDAGPDYVSEPDGSAVYSWGYGCTTNWKYGTAPSTFPSGYVTCPLMQVPGPTLIVHEGDNVTINLTNNLPVAAGNTSIVFPGFTVRASGGAPGLLTQEAVHGGTVRYTFTATKPGTYAYYSGTQPDLQIEMGMYGALIVLPTKSSTFANCKAVPTIYNNPGELDYRLAPAAYDHPETCYDREYLFQFAEMDSNIHAAAQVQVDACTAAMGPPTNATSCPAISVATDPYVPNFYLINGRAMPDDMDPSFYPNYPRQPYNGNPHMHPGELMLIREIGQGRIQHPFHIHGNHARVIARDGNLLLVKNDPLASTTVQARLAGPLVFTFPTVDGQAVDGIFTWTGKNLNWDVYNHQLPTGAAVGATPSGNPYSDPIPCIPDKNGYYTSASVPPAPSNAPNYGEWCADHNKPIPITPADPQIVANGLWYSGTPYLGLQNNNGGFNSTPLPPGVQIQQAKGEAGYAYMWHSHDEREITTNDVFPGGMMMMLIVDPPAWLIDETL